MLNMKAGGRLAVGVLGTLINVSIALSVVRFTTASTDFVSKVLDSKPFSVVGQLSYSIYLWQHHFSTSSDAIATRFPLNLLLVIACATASYYFVEQPCLALREKFRPAKTLNKVTSPAIAEAPPS
jgi:peptidoglycan/LPS O-acetylase OafA/YrhL